MAADGEIVARLLEPDSALLRSLLMSTNAKRIDETARALVTVFQAHGQLLRLVRIAIEDHTRRRLMDGEGAPVLLRVRMGATRVITESLHAVGGEFVASLIAPIVSAFIEDVCSCEVIPDRLQPGEDLAANTTRALQLCQIVFYMIHNAVAYPPRYEHEQRAATSLHALQAVFHVLRGGIDAAFPGRGASSCGMLFVLQLVNPALLMPFNIKSGLPKEVRRNVIVVAKSLQNLANGCQFGQMEFDFLPLNAFIVDNRARMEGLGELLGTWPPAGESVSCEPPNAIVARAFTVSPETVANAVLAIQQALADAEADAARQQSSQSTPPPAAVAASAEASAPSTGVEALAAEPPHQEGSSCDIL